MSLLQLVWSFLFVVALFTLYPSLVFSADEPIQVRGDKVEYFDQLQKIIASGNVVATHNDIKLRCDEATIYMETKDAYLIGNVSVLQRGSLLKGSEILYNFETKKGTILNAEVETGPFRSTGDRAQKVAATEYLSHGGYLSTCDFENPHSRMQSREITVYLDDRVVLKNVVMYLGEIPVMYLPSYTHLLDDKRPRVTLTPGKSDDWGIFLLTSWRAYVNEDLQGKIYFDTRERRGVAGGTDLKYHLPEGGDGIIRSYFADEDDVVYYRAEEGEFVKRRYRERLQLRHLWDIDRTTKATLEIHQMKDATVVKDFFPMEFGADQTPQTYFQIIRSTPWYGLTFLYTQRVNTFQTVTQQWPQLNLQVSPLPLTWLPVLGLSKEERALRNERTADSTSVSHPGWYYQSGWNYSHTNVSSKLAGLSDSQIKIGTLQELFYITKLFGWLNTRPFVQFQETIFTRSAAGTDNLFRQAGAAGFDLSTRVFKIYDIQTDRWGLGINRIRHIINPTVNYKYQGHPTVPKERLFGGGDGLTKSNTVTTSIEHKLQTKRMFEGTWQAVDLVRFLTGVTYDIEGPNGRGGEIGNFLLDLETKPYPWLYFESDAVFNPHLSRFETINADILAAARRKTDTESRILEGSIGKHEYNRDESGFRGVPWGVGLGWRYQRNTSAQLVVETEFDLDPKWRVGIYQGFDVKRFVTEVSSNGNTRIVKRIYESPDFSYRLRRDLHEWTAELVFNYARGEGRAVMLLFRLKDFPDLPLDFQRHYRRPKGTRTLR